MSKIRWYPIVKKTKSGDLWGFINKNGQYGLQPYFEYAYDFEENGLAVVEKNSLYGIINSELQYVVSPKYESITPTFKEGKTQAINQNGYIVINELGEELTKKAYSFIGTYHENRAVFANTVEDGNYRYGYLDENGEEIIKAQYEMAHDFYQGKAVVKIKENEYALIDLQGNRLKAFSYAVVGELREGKMFFQENSSNLFGYLDEQGQIIIKPQYNHAQSFRDGRAIIGMGEDYRYRYGLIDVTGKFIMEPIYDDLRMLGSNRVAVGKASNPDLPYFTSSYAIATTDGQILTDYLYEGLMDYDRDYASAYNQENTFFIDLEGKIAQHLPIVKGAGTLRFIGQLIKANVDDRLSYYNLYGELIWKQSSIIPLRGQYRIIEKKYRPHRNYVIYIPQIAGMTDVKTEQQVNRQLQLLSIPKKIPNEDPLEFTYSGDYSIEFFEKDLLVLKLEGYYYQLGAAHGMPFQTYPHLNLKTGQFYQLADLFKKNSDYIKVISEIIQEQIDSGTSEFGPYIFPDAYKGIRPDQPFYVNEKELAIYFAPYEIAAYAAGFPTFYIPYEQIINIIDTDGEFWRSCNRSIQNITRNL